MEVGTEKGGNNTPGQGKLVSNNTRVRPLHLRKVFTLRILRKVFVKFLKSLRKVEYKYSEVILFLLLVSPEF